MGPGYPSYTMLQKNSGIIHIYGAKSIVLLFCVQQNTESE